MKNARQISLTIYSNTIPVCLPMKCSEVGITKDDPYILVKHPGLFRTISKAFEALHMFQWQVLSLETVNSIIIMSQKKMAKKRM